MDNRDWVGAVGVDATPDPIVPCGQYHIYYIQAIPQHLAKDILMETTIGIDLSELGIDCGISAEELLRSANQSYRGQGKSVQELTGGISRMLEQKDIDSVAGAAVGISSAPPLKALRDRHHLAAQLISKGYKMTEVANLTGYSVNRLSILKNDPSFAELLAIYREQNELLYTDTVMKMKALTDDAVEVLQERLEINPESISNGQLIDIVTSVADRAGFSPVQKSVSVNLPVDPSHIENIKARAAQRQLGQVKRITQEASNAEYKTIESIEGTYISQDN